MCRSHLGRGCAEDSKKDVFHVEYHITFYLKVSDRCHFVAFHLFQLFKKGLYFGSSQMGFLHAWCSNIAANQEPDPYCAVRILIYTRPVLRGRKPS